MMYDEQRSGKLRIHRCPVCGKGGLTRNGYIIHWSFFHKAASLTGKRPPYRLDSPSSTRNSSAGSGNTPPQ